MNWLSATFNKACQLIQLGLWLLELKGGNAILILLKLDGD